MPLPPATKSLARRAAIVTASAWLCLLLAAASPWKPAAGIYDSGVFWALGLLLALWSLWACVPALRKKNWKGVLLHLPVPLIAAGALLDAFHGDKITAGAYVGEQFASSSLHDVQTGRRVDLGFELSIKDFTVSHYPRAFWLCLREDGELRRLERAVLDQGAVFFPKARLALPESELRAHSGQWIPYLSLPGGRVCVMEEPLESDYAATVRITRNAVVRETTLRVNSPISEGGWRFYLMSHGTHADKNHVVLLAKKSPGSLFIKTGVWLLAAACLAWAFSGWRKEAA